MTTEPEPTNDDGAKKALEAERRARKEAEARARDLASRVAELESADLRREIASERGLTSAQAKRLTGSTREELEADAAALLEAFAPEPKAPVPAGRPHELRGGNEPYAPIDDAQTVADSILSKGRI